MSPPSDPIGGRPKRLAAKQKRKKQIALIGVLVVALAVALLTQPGDSPVTSENAINVPSLRVVSANAKGRNQNAPTPSVVLVRELPAISADEIQQADLFFTPSQPEVESVVAEDSSVVEPETEHRVGAIYGVYNGQKRMALINGKIVRVGETLDDGSRVHSVAPDSVQIAQ